jgi:hypothetical protein
VRSVLHGRDRSDSITADLIGRCKKTKKKETGASPARPTSERFCGPAPGPSPIFVRLIKKRKKRKGDVHCHYLAQYTPHQNHQKNKTNNTSASPSFLPRHAFPPSFCRDSVHPVFVVVRCFRRRTLLPRHGFGPFLCHGVHIASLLHIFRALATAILQHRVRSLPIETSFFVLIRLLPCVCAIFCQFSFEPASVSLVHCNMSSCVLSLISVKLLFKVALPRLSPPCAFPWVLSYDQH